ncbi:MAG: polyribonucleotide nucleotidyltransferase [Candidatus Wallbacteria bacterium]|nr:polyribonucleotide nucleotidyltransferase [Candidatus Wallbacteria bacterium]
MSTGVVARQASGSVLVQAGETVVLVAAVGSDSPRPGIDFFPLTCDYREHSYAAGKIPGGFFKRQGRPSTKETLSSRLMDRPLRPLFPKGYKNEVQIQSFVLSFDGKNQPDVLALTGASAALHISDIPFAGPVAAVRMGRIDGQLVVNLSIADDEKSDLDLIVAGTEDAVMMVEAGSKGLSEEDFLQAIAMAHEEIKKLCRTQQELRRLVGIDKRAFTAKEINAQLMAELRDLVGADLADVRNQRGKKAVNDRMKAISKKIEERFQERIAGGTVAKGDVDEIFGKLTKEEFRRLVIQERIRPDGRKFDEIRPINIKTAFLPRTHGSALFTRGETQALATVTLGATDDEQIIDGLEETYRERFLLHYNFPSFSVGEVKPIRGPGRREIGHGALAQRALQSALPGKEKFPYTVRVVTEILESNGSSSMATVCASSLAMMDAGIPVEQPISGIAMGLVKEADKYAILTDIQGWEDHYGDMDFKVAGGESTVTALQMDIKISGVSIELMREALAQAREARVKILRQMTSAIPQPRPDLSPYAPRILSIPIKPDKIGALIGPGGKVIRGITEQTGVKIEIDDDTNMVNIVSNNAEASAAAEKIVRAIIEEPIVGKIYEGKAVRLTKFGVFVEIIPGQDGLCHVSQLDFRRVENVEDFCKLGDIMPVKLIKIDDMGRLDLSRREALIELGQAPEGWSPAEEGSREARGPRREHSGPSRGPSRGPRRDGPGGGDRGPRRDHGGPRREGGHHEGDRGPDHGHDHAPRPPRPAGEGE